MGAINSLVRNYTAGPKGVMKFFDKNIDAVIFDMDGTILDTERIAIKIFTEVTKALGRPLAPEFLEKLIGLNAVATEKLIKETHGFDYPIDEVKKRAKQLKLQQVKQYGLPVKKGVQEVLALLHQNNVPLALATSTDRKQTEQNLLLSGLHHYFSVTVCGNEVRESKPAPEIFLAAAELLGSSSAQCIVFEDSENGLLAASRAGTIPILVKDIKYPVPEIRKLAFREYELMNETIRHFNFSYNEGDN